MNLRPKHLGLAPEPPADLPPLWDDVERFDVANDDARPSGLAMASEAAPFPGRLWTPAEIWEPLPPPDYLVGGFLLRGNVAMLNAFGSSLKTWAMIDLVLATASGGSWLARFPCVQGAAAVVDWESGDYEMRRRIQRTGRARGLLGPVEGLTFTSFPSFNFASDNFVAAVRHLARDRALVCFDSLSAGSPGIDENDARFASGLNTLKAVAADTGCAFLVLHHSKKVQGNGGGPVDLREMARGTGAIFAACDVVVQLTKADGGMLATQTKARGGKAVEPFVLRVDDIAEDATRVHATDPAPAEEGEAVSTASSFDDVKRRIVLLLGHERDIRSGSELARRVKGKKKTTLDALSELLDRGLVIEHGGTLRLKSEVA